VDLRALRIQHSCYYRHRPTFEEGFLARLERFATHAINHYRLDGDDPSIAASGHTVFDLGVAKPVRRGVEFNLSLDNLTNHDYYETQNLFDQPASTPRPAIP